MRISSASCIDSIASNVPDQLAQLVPSNCPRVTPGGMANVPPYTLLTHVETTGSAGCTAVAEPVSGGCEVVCLEDIGMVYLLPRSVSNRLLFNTTGKMVGVLLPVYEAVLQSTNNSALPLYAHLCTCVVDYYKLC